jgi:hypothetical protein
MRTSMDINLHRVALLKQARDGLPTWLLRSIIRTWLCGFILDRTLSAQLGKPSSVRGENSVSFYMDLIRQGMQGGKDDVRVASLAVSKIRRNVEDHKADLYRSGRRFCQEHWRRSGQRSLYTRIPNRALPSPITLLSPISFTYSKSNLGNGGNNLNTPPDRAELKRVM